MQLTGTNQPTTSTPTHFATRPLCGSRTTNTTPPKGCPSVLTGSQSYGGHSEGETPGPIPNPEAKPFSADGTALETGWESRTPPDNPSPKAHPTPGWAFGISAPFSRTCRPAETNPRPREVEPWLREVEPWLREVEPWSCPTARGCVGWSGWVVVPRLPSAARSSRLPPGPPRPGAASHPATSSHRGPVACDLVAEPPPSVAPWPWCAGLA